MTKTIAKMISKLTDNEREQQRLAQVVDKDIENFNGHKFHKAKRNIGGKWKTVLLPILDNTDMKDFLSNQLETIRLASIITTEYENGNTKQLIKK